MAPFQTAFGLDQATSTVSDADIASFENQLIDGTATDFTDFLHQIGVTSGEASDLTNQIITADNTHSLAGQPLATLFTDFEPAFATEAAVLRNWSADNGPGPTITGISPASGSVTGGTSVTITGTNMEATTGIEFDTAPAESFRCTPTSCTAVSPPEDVGTVNIQVDTPDGSARSADLLNYNSPPAVTSLSPAAGPESGGNTVTVSGVQPSGSYEIDFGSQPAVNQACHVGWCTATVPPGAGTVDVVWKTPDGATWLVSPNDRYTSVPRSRTFFAAVTLRPATASQTYPHRAIRNSAPGASSDRGQ